MGFWTFINELKRRNLYKVAVVYGITGWVIVQVASVAANTFGAPSWVMKMIITFILLGFPIAMVLTWAFEVTPDGVRKTRPAQNETQDARKASERYFWIGISVVVVLLFGGWWYLSRAETNARTKSVPAQITDRSIAVLPLKSVSNKDGPLPLAEGLHEDLLTRLANISDLKVISRTSVEKFENTKLTLPAIAESLDVKWILEGGVQKGSSNVRINAQLIDPSTDTHIWAKTYQRNLTANNVFAIQGDIAREIANALQVQLSLDEQERITGAPTQDLEAYRLYVKGRQQLAQRTFTGNKHQLKAVDYFKQAIALDSTFALAWSGIADAAAIYPLADSNVFDDLPWDQEAAARRALELKPKLAEAQASMGFVYLRNMNAPAALDKLKYAVKLKPSYWQAHFLLGELYFHIGRPQQALTHLKLTVDLNPNHARARHWLYDAYNSAGQHKKALQEARRQQQLGLENIVAVMGEVRALTRLGRLGQAHDIAEQQLNKLPNQKSVPAKWFRAYLVQILSAQGDTTAAKTHLKRLKSINAEPPFLGWAYLGIGMIDKALQTYQEIEGSGWGNIGVLDRLRYYGDEHPAIKDKPRYQQLLRKANIAWGLNPDGSIPDEFDVQIPSES